MTNFDTIVIGGGTNGMAAALFLAKRGKKVALLEQRGSLGGLSGSTCEESNENVRGPLQNTAQLSPEILDSLGLASFGLKWKNHKPPTAFTDGQGRFINLQWPSDSFIPSIRGATTKDLENNQSYRRFLKKVTKILDETMVNQPPELLPDSFLDFWSLLKKGFQFRSMGKQDMMDTLRAIPMPAADWISEWFKDPLMQAGLIFPSFVGNHLGPFSPGSNLNHLLAESLERITVSGGTRVLIQALEKGLNQHQVHVRTNSKVTSILTKEGRVCGVKLEDGQEIKAKDTLSTLDLKNTFFNLLPPRLLQPSFEDKIVNFRSRGSSATLHLTFKEPQTIPELNPEFKSNGSLKWARSIEHLERSFDCLKYGILNEDPCFEIRFFESDNRDVWEINLLFTPYHLKEDWNEDSENKLKNNVLNKLELGFPGLSKNLHNTTVTSPKRLEDKFNLTQGHVLHGEMSIDQWLGRPVPELSRYSSPIPGLTLGGNACHGGGGVTMVPGVLSAKSLL
jgi:phytoene dehydrogenase-like protein